MFDNKTVHALLDRYELSPAMLERILGPLTRYDAVLLTGSVAEGLSEASSDVDFLVVGAVAPEQGERFEGDSGIASVCVNLESKTLLDLQCMPPAAVEELGARFTSALSILETDPSSGRKPKIRTVSMNDRLILHRLRTAICISGSDAVDKWRSQYRLNLLPDYQFHTAMAGCFSRRQDARSKQASDRYSCLLMLQEAAGFLSDAVLASVGESNPNPKWRARLMHLHASRLEASHIEELLKLMLVGADADTKERLDDFDQVLGLVVTRLFEQRPDLAAQSAYWVQRLGWSRFSD